MDFDYKIIIPIAVILIGWRLNKIRKKQDEILDQIQKSQIPKTKAKIKVKKGTIAKPYRKSTKA